MKLFSRFAAAAFAVFFAFTVPQAFIHMDKIMTVLRKGFPLRVEPSFTGGEKMAVFLDPAGDDSGSGTLVYPRNELWQKDGVLDLVRYTVHFPVINAKWGSLPDYWQLDFTFASLDNAPGGRLGFSYPVIHVYLDIMPGGSAETLESRAELAVFPEEYAWDFVLHIDGFSEYGKITSYDGKYQSPLLVIPDHQRNTIIARIPLEKNGILSVIDMPETRHYVLVGAYNQLSKSNFMTVENTAGQAKGGGAESRLTPRIYDYLAPQGISQKEVLSSYNEDEYRYAMLKPVFVSSAADTGIDEEYLNQLKVLARKEVQSSAAEKISAAEITSRYDDLQERMRIMFMNGYFSEAENLIDSLLSENGRNGTVLAYKGSLTAVRGGQAENIAESVRLVNEAFDIFSEADKLLPEGPDRLDLLYNRGNTAMSVPELVFGKAARGAADFMEAAEICLSLGDGYKKAAAEAFYKAGLCYEKAENYDRAELAFNQALSYPEISADTRYSLALKGYVIYESGDRADQ